MREGGTSYFLHVTKKYLKDRPVTFPGALGRPPHRSAAQQRTFVRDSPPHKARSLMVVVVVNLLENSYTLPVDDKPGAL